MISKHAPAVLFGLALGSMAWSHAAHSSFSILAGIALLLTAPDSFLKRIPSYAKYLPLLLAAIAIGYFQASSHSVAMTDIKGLWPLAHLITAAVAINSNNAKYFINAFMYLAGLGALYSILQYFSFVPLSNHAHQGGLFIGTSHIWAHCVAMTSLAAISFDFMLRNSGTQKIVSALICCTSLISLWANQERANFILAVACLILIALLHKNCTKRVKCAVVITLPLLTLVAISIAGSKLGSLANLFHDPQAVFNPLRIAHWQVAFEEFKSAPWFGHGLGAYPQLVAENVNHSAYLTPFVARGHIWCHNMPLQLLVTTGIFGFSLVTYVMFKITMPLIRDISLNNQAAVLGLCACLIHFGASITDTPGLQSVRLAAFTILIGFAYGAKQRD